MDYRIPFRGLKEGKHTYEFTMDRKFFELFSESEIKEGELNAKVELSKRSNGLEAEFTINGIVKVICDRCLDEFDFPIHTRNKLFFEFGEENREVTDELIMLSASESLLNLGQYIYEFINLNLPLQRIHPDDEFGNSLCNSTMLKKLNDLIVHNNDDEIEDPRWGKLKDLIN